MSRKRKASNPVPSPCSNTGPARVSPVLTGFADHRQNDEPRPSELYRMTAKHLPVRTKMPSVCNGGSDLRWKGSEPWNYEEREKQKASVKLEMAHWLDGLSPWDWFSTYTFANPVSANAAHYMFQRHFDWLEKEAGMPIYAFRGDEYGASNGRFHIHALLGNVGGITVYCGERLRGRVYGRPCCAVHGWPCGHARVYRYDPKIGATGYVTKYVTKDEFGDWGLYGDFKPIEPTDPQSRLDLEDASPIEIPSSEVRPLLGVNETEASAIAAAGRRIDLLQEGRVFDETALLQSPLFDGLEKKQLLLPHVAPKVFI